MRSTIQTLLLAALTAWSLCGVVAWIVRDGMGPDSVESHGWEALTRFFWSFYWGPVLLLLGAAAVLWSRHVRRASIPASADSAAT